MSQQKQQQRQTTLFSFFSLPSKKKKKAERCDKKANETQSLKTAKKKSSSTITSSETVAASRPAIPKTKLVAAEHESNHCHRKRPRPQPSINKAVGDHRYESWSEGPRKIKLRDDESMDNQQMKENIVNSQEQEVASSSPSLVSMPKSDQQDEHDEGMSSGDDESSQVDADENCNGMSAYELLRLRNMERNNARLASLGLLSHLTEQPPPPQAKKRPKKKIPATRSVVRPTRRSTRTRKSVLSDPTDTRSTAFDSNPERLGDKFVEPRVEHKEEEEAETYTVSPLVQYAMTSSLATNADKDPSSDSTISLESGKGSISSYSLHPMGPRLTPPKGLKAIYSLDFFEPPQHNTNNTSWLVGAGKSGIVALWDCQRAWNGSQEVAEDAGIDPTLTWKAHNGRWIAEARFLPNHGSPLTPSRLITAANDGKVCLWDLSTVSVQSGAPKRLSQSGGELHTSGIFAMDVANHESETWIATGSKDKTVALSMLHQDLTLEPIWKSNNVHTAKVGAVRFHPTRRGILASASDDNLVCVHDSKCAEHNGVVIQLANIHHRPHSVVWDPCQSDLLLTAGLDHKIKLWDIRSTQEPIRVLEGHVPGNLQRCKRIHHPAFYYPSCESKSAFVLSGGERSQALSMFRHDTIKKQQAAPSKEDANHRLYSRGKLPEDCGDAGCIAVHQDKVAVSVQDGEILILAPQVKKQ